MDQLTTENLAHLQTTQPPIKPNQTINQFIQSQIQNQNQQQQQPNIDQDQDQNQQNQDQNQQHQKNENTKQQQLFRSSSSASIPLRPRVPHPILKPPIIRPHSSSSSSIIKRSQLLKSRAQKRNKNKKRPPSDQIKNHQKHDKKHVHNSIRNHSQRKSREEELSDQKKRGKTQSTNKHNTISSTIKHLPDSLISDPRKRKKSRLTINRNRGPGIFQNAVSGSARRRTISAGDLAFNQLEFLDKANRQTKTKPAVSPVFLTISPRVRLSSAISVHTIEAQPIKNQPPKTHSIKTLPIKSLPVSPLESHQPKIIPQSPSHSSHSGTRQNLVGINFQKKNQHASISHSIQSIRHSRRSHSDPSSGHSAYSLQLRKKIEIATKISDGCLTQQSQNKSITFSHIPSDRGEDQPTALSSYSVYYHQSNSPQLSDYCDQQAHQNFSTLNSRAHQPDFHHPIQDHPTESSLHRHHVTIQNQSLISDGTFARSSPSFPLTETRSTSDHHLFRSPTSLSSVPYSMRGHYSIANQDVSEEAEWWIQDARSESEDLTVHPCRARRSMSYDSQITDGHQDGYHYQRRRSRSSHPASQGTRLTDLESITEFGNPYDQPNHFDSEFSKSGSHTDQLGSDYVDSKVEENTLEDDVDDDRSSIEEPSANFPSDLYADGHEDDGLDWPEMKHRIGPENHRWNDDGHSTQRHGDGYDPWGLTRADSTRRTRETARDQEEMYFDRQQADLDELDPHFYDPRSWRKAGPGSASDSLWEQHAQAHFDPHHCWPTNGDPGDGPSAQYSPGPSYHPLPDKLYVQDRYNHYY